MYARSVDLGADSAGWTVTHLVVYWRTDTTTASLTTGTAAMMGMVRMNIIPILVSAN